MKKLIEITLGVVTGVGGYLEIGSIATAAEGGAGFRYTLLWSLLLATFCVIFFVEIAGRFAAITPSRTPSANDSASITLL